MTEQKFKLERKRIGVGLEYRIRVESLWVGDNCFNVIVGKGKTGEDAVLESIDELAIAIDQLTETRGELMSEAMRFKKKDGS